MKKNKFLIGKIIIETFEISQLIIKVILRSQLAAGGDIIEDARQHRAVNAVDIFQMCPQMGTILKITGAQTNRTGPAAHSLNPLLRKWAKVVWNVFIFTNSFIILSLL